MDSQERNMNLAISFIDYSSLGSSSLDFIKDESVKNELENHFHKLIELATPESKSECLDEVSFNQ
jgi:hypothetical protein